MNGHKSSCEMHCASKDGNPGADISSRCRVAKSFTIPLDCPPWWSSSDNPQRLASRPRPCGWPKSCRPQVDGRIAYYVSQMAVRPFTA